MTDQPNELREAVAGVVTRNAPNLFAQNAKKARNDKTSKSALVGNVFGRLTVTGINERYTCGTFYYFDVICACGVTTCVAGRNLTSGATKSCGCLRREKASERAKASVRHKNGYIVKHADALLRSTLT